MTASSGIAIVGMAARLPGATTIEMFWRNIAAGVDSITRFSDEQLRAAGVPDCDLSDPQYVKARGAIDGVDLFDAEFFGFTAGEAVITDPQHRLFLECVYQALEDAGCVPDTIDGPIALFAGSASSTYLPRVLADRRLVDAMGRMRIRMGNDQDHLATSTAFRLNLRGPAVTVQTTCSTSLVAVHLGCQSLLSGDSDVAIAGGVSIPAVQQVGYRYEEGGILSPDGRCRAFDALAAGTVDGSGVGVVVLKRLADAVAAGDRIRAVIRGTAVNNDGAAKVGYTAPSVNAQAEVIAEAMAVAGIAPASVSYIEAHGTATALGDPAEIAALSRAFGAHQRVEPCAIGSVKTNIGHLNTAAGVAGLIKTVLALEHRLLPPSLHFTTPRPEIDFSRTPFAVNANARPWPDAASPRRAGVSSFGIGGTNAHVVLEEAPVRECSDEGGDVHVLSLSARSPAALSAMELDLRDAIAAQPGMPLADLAYSLQVARPARTHRRIVVCRSHGEAVAALTAPAPARDRRAAAATAPSITWVLPGQGIALLNLGRALYEQQPRFRAAIDRCSELLRATFGHGLPEVMYPAEPDLSDAAPWRSPRFAQPALFAVQYALGEMWREWGAAPDAVLGHSLGEWAAACVAGVFTVEDAVALVAARGAMIAELPPGAMVAVAASTDRLQEFLEGALDVAAVNGPQDTVVSGREPAIREFEQRLRNGHVAFRRLTTTHAFHGRDVRPLASRLRERIAAVPRQPPTVPILSSMTGTWLSPDTAMDPEYWAQQLTNPVRFDAAADTLFDGRPRAIIEIGPGPGLSALLRRHPARRPDDVIVTTIGEGGTTDGVVSSLTAAGRLWLAGVRIDWKGFYSRQRRVLVSLPGYPFERRRYWVDAAAGGITAGPEQRDDVRFYLPCARRALAAVRTTNGSGNWLLLADETPAADALARAIEDSGGSVRRVSFASLNREDGFDTAIAAFARNGGGCDHLVHLWSLGDDSGDRRFADDMARGYDAVVAAVQAWLRRDPLREISFTVITNQAMDATGLERVVPAKAAIVGACRVIPQEHPQIACRCIDIGAATLTKADAERVVAEMLGPRPSRCEVVALRGAARFVEGYQPVSLPAAGPWVRERGVYLIVGGLGKIGLAVAAYLARTARARVGLLSRTGVCAPDSAAAQRLESIRSYGGEARLLAGNVARHGDTERAFRALESEWGPLDGVFHAAGWRGTGVQELQTLGPAATEPHFDAKIHGLHALAEAMAPRAIPFCVVFSSTAALVGGIGFTAYAAASSFADSFVAQQRGDVTRWISINWDGWPGGSARQVSRATERLTIPEAAALDALARVVAQPDLSRIVAAAMPLEGRELVQAPASAPAVALPSSDPEPGWLQCVLEIWTSVLGSNGIDPDANFFDLGGDSLLLIRVRARIAQMTGHHFPVARLFEHPTATRLAAFLAAECHDSPVVAPDAVTTEAQARGLRQRAALGAAPRNIPSL